jgi:peptidoglycan-N-acetylglucosamine deacetylase
MVPVRLERGAVLPGALQPRLGWAAWPPLGVAGWAFVDLAAARVPSWPEATACSLALASLVWSAADLRSRGFVRAVTRGSGRRAEVAITFDDGPDPATTRGVLETLAAARVQASFFLLGSKAEQHPALVREICAAGHDIGSHGYEHRWQAIMTPWRARRNLTCAAEAIAAACGQPPIYFRPPYGVATPALRGALVALGVSAIGWSVRPYDASGRGDPEARAQRILERLRPGDIILLHDAPERAGKRVPLGPAILPSLLSGMRAKGLQPVTLSQLLR